MKEISTFDNEISTYDSYQIRNIAKDMSVFRS